MATRGRVLPGNLPVELTSFVGRQRELAELRGLLPRSRMVTLTGVGGTGKTRLALRTAESVRGVYPDGAWFVDLAQLHEPGLRTGQLHGPEALAELVRSALELRDLGGVQPVRALVDQLSNRTALLVLDNCEHVVAACALLVDSLLGACPRVTILATSREPLSLSGETVFPVPPLLSPPPGEQLSVADLDRFEAVSLFLDRAESVMPGFALTDENHLAVADLCHHLDGLPLAIELAAARVRVLSPRQILDRMAQRFALLGRGRRDAPGRQRTLRACMNWTFDLCSEQERLLWARLSLFAGEFELDAVEGICADERLPEAEVLDRVTGLFDKSILVSDGHLNGDRAVCRRYRMLETIRDYGLERLQERGEHAGQRRRFRDWYGWLVSRAREESIGPQQRYWVQRLGRETPNLRVAVEYSVDEQACAEVALRLAVNLATNYWWARGTFGEGRRWLDQALAQAPAPTTLRARSLVLASHLAFTQGDVTAGTRFLRQGQDLAQRLDAAAELAYAGYIRGIASLFANDLGGAGRTLEQALATLAPVVAQELELQLDILVALEVATGLAGDSDRAHTCHERILAITHPRRSFSYESQALWALGLSAWRQGDLARAVASELECLRVVRGWESDDLAIIALSLEVLAWVAARQRQYRDAVTLLGATDALWTRIGSPIASFGHLAGHHVTCERQCRDALDDDAFAEAFQRGRCLTSDEAIAWVLQEQREQSRASHPATTPLTRRETQVAELVARGLNNKDIATALVVSPRTAEGHVERILTKLGFTSRTQIVAWHHNGGS